MDLLYFAMSAALGIIGWSVIFATLVWPKMKNQSRVWRLKLLTATHFFRYFGTTMLITGLVVQKLPTGFANPAAFGDLITVLLAYIAFIALQRSRDDNARFPTVWLLNIFGTADLLLAAILGPVLIKDPANFGFTYFIPTFYVPLLFVTHFYAFKTLKERAHE
jgi:hypothetical protein